MRHAVKPALMFIFALALTIGLLALQGCTDAAFSSLEALGSPAQVTCYSGGKVVYDGRSTGRVSSTEKSDGWEFREAGTGDFVRVSGDCIVRN